MYESQSSFGFVGTRMGFLLRRKVAISFNSIRGSSALEKLGLKPTFFFFNLKKVNVIEKRLMKCICVPRL